MLFRLKGPTSDHLYSECFTKLKLVPLEEEAGRDAEWSHPNAGMHQGIILSWHFLHFFMLQTETTLKN